MQRISIVIQLENYGAKAVVNIEFIVSELW